MHLAMADTASGDERAVIDTIITATIAQCRTEGLSHEQAACILAAHVPDWDDQLRACPAFAAKPSSWVILRPPRAERAAVPDGSHEGPVHYRQLVGLPFATCGLRPDGNVACWGTPMAVAVPAGHYTQIAIDPDVACGLDADGHAHCAVADAAVRDRTPGDAFAAIAIDDYDGCGIRRDDHTIACWTDLDDPPLDPPKGAFSQIAMTHGAACALSVDGQVSCFGREAPTPPAGAFRSLSSATPFCGIAVDGTAACWPNAHAPAGTKLASISCARGECCELGDDHHVTCQSDRFGPVPAGTFDAVEAFVGHACATRTNGGTICWGENDAGECNVPQ